MAEESGGPRSEQDSDYDGAWKKAARHHWAECLATYFLAVPATIDWSSPVEWFDEEVSQILAQAGSRNKRGDMLVNVRRHSGQLQWIPMHFEIQSTPEG
ncbi:MAG: hypothetical protein ACQESR_26910 [Planctomycetota bacterium]